MRPTERVSLKVLVRTVLALTSLVQAVQLVAAPQAARQATSSAPAFLVAAPDRGFLGDEEVRDAFEAFAQERNAALLFVTDQRTGGSLDTALQTLAAKGGRRVVVLPLFLSREDPRYARLASLLSERASPSLSVSWARPFGESYFAVEELADRLRGIRDAGKTRVVVVGTGGRDEGALRRMQPDWERLARLASAGLGFESVRAVVESDSSKLESALQAAADGAARSVIVPFHLGSKLDGMMSFTAAVRGAAPDGADVIEGDVTPDPTVGMWMAREANRQDVLRPEDVGVVVLAHGSDYHWNETMRQAVAPLGDRYKIEPAFSMADPVVIERAVRRLEARGARVIVILRVFGLASSFRASVERLIGLDVERGDASALEAHSAMGHGHAHGDSAAPARIRSGAVLLTAGGIEDDPLFAEALLSRAQALSRDPSHETVILVAHGDGDDVQDKRWRGLLESLATRMRAMGGQRFRAIKTGTWREDWPDKREAAVKEVRSYVEEGSAAGGRAIVIPARTLGRGPESELLEGLSFELGEGFAPLPLFARWAEKEVKESLEIETRSREAMLAGGAAQKRAQGSEERR